MQGYVWFDNSFLVSFSFFVVLKILLKSCEVYFSFVWYIKTITMAQSEFVVIQFDEEGGNGLAVIHTKWLTPRKTEVFWPPFKDSSLFNKALKQGQEIDDKWKLYSIKKKFFETDDLDIAKKKLKRA